MKPKKFLALSSSRRRPAGKERGVALITTLLLLMLLTGLTLTMAWSARSDMLINGYYRNFRGSFYAADSGLNVVRQEMINQFKAGGVGYPTAFVPGKAPIQNNADQLVADYLNNKYGNGTFIATSGPGQAAGSWPGKYTVTFKLTFNHCEVAGGGCLPPPVAASSLKYFYDYTITAQGQSKGTENAVLLDRGLLTVNVTMPNSPPLNFAAWGMFIDQYNVCDGSTLVPGTISGPVFTNGSWNFGNTGKYTFTDPVGQNGPTAGYQGNSCAAVAGPAGNGIAPTFQQGFNLGKPKTPLPLNDFNQQRAVLDGKGTGGSQVTNPDMNKVLLDANKKAYPNNGTSTGVFLPYSIDSSGNAQFNGGGIMVQGDASVQLAPVGGSGQQYTISQGTNPVVTTTIIIDPKANSGAGSTLLTSKVGNNPAVTVPITGVPQHMDPNLPGVSLGDATMLYVNGSITSLSGPGQGKPAIQDGTQLTITAANNVAITGDLLYKSEPVTLTQTTDPVTGKIIPPDTLIPLNDTQQALGIFTATGDIQLNNKQANGNLEIDASLATISQGGTGGLINVTNSTIGTLTIVGGRIQNNIKSIGATTRNVMFDRRYANGNFAPPWFPATPVPPGGSPPGNTDPSAQRLQWQNQTAYY
jgi:hypothetical protein